MERLLKLQHVEALVSLKKSKIYALIAAGQFPRPVKVGRSSMWLKSEIAAWIALAVAQKTIATADALPA